MGLDDREWFQNARYEKDEQEKSRSQKRKGPKSLQSNMSPG